MEFLIIAYDGKDPDALNRRMKVREAHLRYARIMKEQGHFIEGGAILDEEGKMIGSTLLLRFESRKALDQWLNNDPYKLGNVWLKVEVRPIKLVKL